MVVRWQSSSFCSGPQQARSTQALQSCLTEPNLVLIRPSDAWSGFNFLWSIPCFKITRRLAVGARRKVQWTNPGNKEGTWAAQSSPHKLSKFLKLSWNVESKERLWTKPHVPDRVLCPLQCTDRWSFHQENIWEFWVRGSLILQRLAH